MTKARKGILAVDDPQHHGNHQRGKGDKVIGEPPPQEHAKHGGKQGEQDDLIGGHERTLRELRPKP